MELVLHWFLLVKVAAFLVFGYAAYGFIKSKFKSKFWGILTAVFLFIGIFSPIKMDMNTSAQTNRANASIKASKIIKPKVEDSGFSTAVSSDRGITGKDLE
jgi:hypothetical protein